MDAATVLGACGTAFAMRYIRANIQGGIEIGFDAATANLIAAQDYIAQVSQGIIADRSSERLGKADAGVILLRKLFKRELDAIMAGRPTKQWRQRYEPADLPVPPGVSKEAVALTA